jgi:hypothetical protein
MQPRRQNAVVSVSGAATCSRTSRRGPAVPPDKRFSLSAGTEFQTGTADAAVPWQRQKIGELGEVGAADLH